MPKSPAARRENPSSLQADLRRKQAREVERIGNSRLRAAKMPSRGPGRGIAERLKDEDERSAARHAALDRQLKRLNGNDRLRRDAAARREAMGDRIPAPPPRQAGNAADRRVDELLFGTTRRGPEKDSRGRPLRPPAENIPTEFNSNSRVISMNMPDADSSPDRNPAGPGSMVPPWIADEAEPVEDGRVAGCEPGRPVRVVVTGSRDFDSPATMRRALDRVAERADGPLTLVHGAARGADQAEAQGRPVAGSLAVAHGRQSRGRVLQHRVHQSALSGYPVRSAHGAKGGLRA